MNLLATSLLIAIATTNDARPVSFMATDGVPLQGVLYGAGTRAVVLAHGGRFTKESWTPQARQLVEHGYRVLTFDFRGFGESKVAGVSDPMSAPLHRDVLGAVRFLKQNGASTVFVVGGSLGGSAAGAAVAEAALGEIGGIVLLGAPSYVAPEKLTARKLYIVTRDDFSGDHVLRLPRIQAEFDKAPEPKKLLVLEGAAHAQAMFATPDGPRVMNEILRFLAAPSPPKVAPPPRN